MWLVYTIASAVVSLALLARVAGRIVISWVARSQAMVNGIERAPPLAPPAPAQQPASRPMLAKLRQSAFYAIDQGQLNLLRAAIKLTDANGARLDLDALVDYNVDYNVKHSLLHLAVRRQKVECVRCLLAAGASPLVLSQGSPQLRQLPLRDAAIGGNVEIIRLLLEAGAPVDVGDGSGNSPISLAAGNGHLDCVQCLSSYGAQRGWPEEDVRGVSAEEACNDDGEDDATDEEGEDDKRRQRLPPTLAWLVSSQGWTPLHHVEHLTPERARALLRDGADVHAAPSPTPLERARAILSPHQGEALRPQTAAVAQLIVQGSQPWAPGQVDDIFPEATRRYALFVRWLGKELAAMYDTSSTSLEEVWVSTVMARHLIFRQTDDESPEKPWRSYPGLECFVHAKWSPVGADDVRVYHTVRGGVVIGY